MWKNTVRPTLSHRPSAIDVSTSIELPLLNFVPRPIKQRRQIFEGGVFNVQFEKNETHDSFFLLINRIIGMGGITTKSESDPKITHYIVAIPERDKVSRKRYEYREVKGFCKWQQVVKEHGRWYGENGFEVEKNRREGRFRRVLTREWIEEVMSGQSQLREDEQEQGHWEVCLRYDEKQAEKDRQEAKISISQTSSVIKIAIDPRLRPPPPAATPPSEPLTSPPPYDYLFTPPPSATTDKTDVMVELDLDPTIKDGSPGKVAVKPTSIQTPDDPLQRYSHSSFSQEPLSTPLDTCFDTPPASASAHPRTYPYDRSGLLTPSPSTSPDATMIHVSPIYEAVPLFSIDAPFGYKVLGASRMVAPTGIKTCQTSSMTPQATERSTAVRQMDGDGVSQKPQNLSVNIATATPQDRANAGKISLGGSTKSAPTPTASVARQTMVESLPHQVNLSAISREGSFSGFKRPRPNNDSDKDNVRSPLPKRKSLPMPATHARSRSSSDSSLSSLPSESSSRSESDSMEEGEIGESDEEMSLCVGGDSDTGGYCVTDDLEREMSLQEAMIECDIVLTMAEMMIKSHDSNA